MTDEPRSGHQITRRAALAAVGAAPLVAGAAPAAVPRRPEVVLEGVNPPGDVRAMLREISARNIRRTIEKLVSFHTRHTLSVQDDPVRGIGAARDWLFAEFQKAAQPSGGRMTVELMSYIQEPVPPRIPVPTRITNVVATLRGTQADSVGRTYVTSGHYDSMPKDILDAESFAPGANDDASGVAAVLEAARVMATREFDATIVFMAVAGEEQGLFGANRFAQLAQEAGTDIAGMFTNDVVGSSLGQNGVRDPFTVRIFAEGMPTAPSPLEVDWRRFGTGEIDSPARQLARYVKEVAENSATRMKVRLMYRRDRYGRGGDHIPFLDRGWAAARFTEPNEDWRHQHEDVRVVDGVQIGDLPQFCDFDYIARVSRVNAISLANLARAPAAPKGVLIDPTGFKTSTDLRWTANTEPDLAGYEVMVRETSAPLWEKAIPVGNVTSVSLPNDKVFKDNEFFGVRAVDKSGYRSPVSFPRPAPPPG